MGSSMRRVVRRRLVNTGLLLFSVHIRMLSCYVWCHDLLWGVITGQIAFNGNDYSDGGEVQFYSSETDIFSRFALRISLTWAAPLLQPRSACRPWRTHSLEPAG